ncbi:MAG TPA: hypothetical protein VFU35_03500 [Jatrophihabitans sp.]|nr:hypothetical protein [Jatrophihabitans sp.]
MHIQTAYGVACAALLGALSACADGTQPTFTIAGTYAIYGDVGLIFTTAGRSCAGARDARSIVGGTSVTVTDLNDITLATGSLGGGTYRRLPDAVSGLHNQGVCTFELQVANVPEGKPFYRVLIGGRRVDQLSNAQAHRRIALTFAT